MPGRLDLATPVCTAADLADFPHDTWARLAVVGNRVPVLACSSATGYELHVSDGTARGTTLLKDINPGIADTYIAEITFGGGVGHFGSFDGVAGREPWTTDGTPVGTELFRLDASPTFSCSAAPNRRWQMVITATWNLPVTSTFSITSVQITRPDGLAVATKAGRSTSGSFSTTLKTVTDATGYSCRFYSGAARGDTTTIERTITIGAAALTIAAPSQTLPGSPTSAPLTGGLRR
jgi:ELWxxDGT repeat protein